MIPRAQVLFLGLLLGWLPIASLAAEPTLDSFKKAGAAVCVWKGKANTDDAFVKAVEKHGFKCVYRSPYLQAITCEWSGEISPQMLAGLKSIGDLERVEPAPGMYLDVDKAESTESATDTLYAFQWAGAMTCVWKKGKYEEAIKFVESLGLKCVYKSISSPAIVCEWEGALRNSQLTALKDSDILEYVEPAPSPTLIKAGKGRDIVLPQGKSSFRRIGSRSGEDPDDPMYDKLWNMQHVKAPLAWKYAKASTVVVAVIDSGVDLTHPDIQPNIWINEKEIPDNNIDDDKNGIVDDIYGVDFSDEDLTGKATDGFGHGTHVAGTIGAVGNNKIGVVGVNWSVRLLSLKVFNDKGEAGVGRTLALADAIFYARKSKAKVINLSMRWEGDAEIIGKQFDEAEKEGILIVCSAGNDHSDNDANPHFPASYPNPNVISVAAVNINEQLAGFSNFGAKSVDLAAPGQDVTSTYPTTLGEYKSLNGTSMASPHVAGAAALVWGQPKYAQKTSKEVKSLLLDNARKLNVLG